MNEESSGEDKVRAFARIDGYHLATRRADRKDQVTISVKLFEGSPE